VKANQVTYPIATMCRTLGVSPSGYHAWKVRPPSKRAVEDATLSERIKTFHARSRGTYGAPRIHLDLFDEGIRVGRKRVAGGQREGNPVALTLLLLLKFPHERLRRLQDPLSRPGHRTGPVSALPRLP
jgi:hypothetical protein